MTGSTDTSEIDLDLGLQLSLDDAPSTPHVERPAAPFAAPEGTALAPPSGPPTDPDATPPHGIPLTILAEPETAPAPIPTPTLPTLPVAAVPSPTETSDGTDTSDGIHAADIADAADGIDAAETTPAAVPASTPGPQIPQPDVSEAVPPEPDTTDPDPTGPVEDATPSPVMTGPSAIFSADDVFVPAEHIAPTVPTIAPPAVPIPATAPEQMFSRDHLIEQQANGAKRPPRKPGSWFKRFVVLAALGGLGWAGYTFGPDLYDEYVTGNTVSDAPLAFPTTPPNDVPIRTAQFELSGAGEGADTTYLIKTDFETGVSQVDIARPDQPDLQVLTYATDALIRRADGDRWYLLERGQFPLDGKLERSDWVRRLDELLTPRAREQATIDRSVDDEIAGVATRHLTISLAPGLLSADTAVASLGTPAPGTTPASGTPAITDPALDETIAAIGQSGDAVVDRPVGLDDPTAVASSPDVAGGGAIEVEIWVDANGLVRQLSGSPDLGGETLTVLSTSPESWIPNYPDPSRLSALNASALIELGI